MFEILKYRVFDGLTKKKSYSKFQELLKLQWQSSNELEEIRTIKLIRLVTHAYNNTDYYRNLFKKFGIKPSDIKCISDLSKIPILTKSIIIQNRNRFESSNFDSYSPRNRATSGSTGEAFHFTIDKSTHSWVHGYMLLAWSVAGFEFGDKILTIGSGNAKLSPLRRYILSYLKNSIDLSSFNLNSFAILNVIKRINTVKPRIIFGYSSALALLSKYAMDNQISLFSPKAIVTTAENLLPHNRKRIETAFQCKVFDQYGVMECGITAFECELHNGYHIGSTKGVIETINDSDQRIFNTSGRIISTDLDNFAFPILRYDSGDIGTMSKRKCSCGRGFEILDSLEGRTREFLTAIDGTKVHGAVFSYLVRENPWINQYQVFQEEKGFLEIRIISTTTIDSGKVHSVEQFVNSKCGGGMTVNVIQVDDIPLSNNNKRQFIVSTIKNI